MNKAMSKFSTTGICQMDALGNSGAGRSSRYDQTRHCRSLRVVIVVLSLIQLFAQHVFAQSLPPSKEDPGVQAIATTYYAGKYRIDGKLAQLRLAIQDQAAGIEDDLIKLLSDEYAGVWYDALDGGRLKIGMTRNAAGQSAAVTRVAVSRGLAAYTDLVPVTYSEAELQGMRDSVRSKLQDMIDAAHAKTGYSTKSNAVMVTALAKLSASEESRYR